MTSPISSQTAYSSLSEQSLLESQLSTGCSKVKPPGTQPMFPSDETASTAPTQVVDLGESSSFLNRSIDSQTTPLPSLENQFTSQDFASPPLWGQLND